MAFGHENIFISFLFDNNYQTLLPVNTQNILLLDWIILIFFWTEKCFEYIQQSKNRIIMHAF